MEKRKIQREILHDMTELNGKFTIDELELWLSDVKSKGATDIEFGITRCGEDIYAKAFYEDMESDGEFEFRKNRKLEDRNIQMVYMPKLSEGETTTNQ